MEKTVSQSQDMPQTSFQAGVALARAGRKVAARQIFQQIVALDPAYEAAWLYLAGLAEDQISAQDALKRVADLNPANPYLPKAQAWIQQTWPASADQDPIIRPVQSSASQKIKRFLFLTTASLVIFIGLVVAVVIFQGPMTSFAAAMVATPTNTLNQELARLQQGLNRAQTEVDQPAMIAALTEMHALTPDDQQIVVQLAQLYYEQGLILRNGNNFIAAQAAFKQALSIQPDFERARQELGWVDLYLRGAVPHQKADWAAAIPIFEKLYRASPTYPNVAEILYSAYFNQGIVQKAQGGLKEALVSFQKAAAILPEIPEADDKIAEVAKLLTPPTPTPIPTLPATPIPTPQPVAQKRVVVDISDQRTYAYEGDTQVFNFIVSTGEPGRDTAIGEFEILDKIPMAYASTWNLDMPLWLGIYWSGPLENGFHAVPTQRATGVTMWEGYLGQRVSYGCIVLSMKDAALLYNWVDVGTPVSIRR